ncbi:MAG TPA: glycosyltransferase family 39 protein [Fimbriimonadaceae bacterium]|nr:glycosyltransferase family 39 protein [Fimbriimonadaceae bacterium]
MLGALATLVFAALCAFAGQAALSRWTASLDPAERVGIAGLLGLGTMGLLTLLVGLVPGGLTFGLVPILVLVLVGLIFALRKSALDDWKFRLPSSLWLLAPVGLGLIGLIALIAVLAPSTALDWDTIAYHLAVPKLWLGSGQVHYIRGMHQSNFPATMECLFAWGLKWGGQSGAKAFSLAVYAFGCSSMFGLARRWYGANAGWWAALAFAGIPVVAWEAGTGYVDMAHGLYACLAVVYAIEGFVRGDKRLLVLGGLALGFAMGTKYTGLQTLIALAFVVGTAGIVTHQWKAGVKAKVTVAVIAVLVACPWYIKTAVYTGNPVFPFFYSRLGGKDWDAWRTSVYTDEQKSFGVGTSLSSLGSAVLGLAYQPGRYTNPGQQEGKGFPTGALGFAAMLGGLAAALSGKLKREERMVLAVVGVGFLMWFFLSQQSRYLTALVVPLGLLGAGQVSRGWRGTVVGVACAVQLLVTLFVLNKFQTRMQLQVVSGKVGRDAYLARVLPFYPAAQAINAMPGEVKVALYDEVFGYYLDKPYFWANPGHSMLIPYEETDGGAEYAKAMGDLGFTHIYLSLATFDAETRERILQGEKIEQKGGPPEDLNLKWKYLLIDAMNKGDVRVVQAFRAGVLFEIVR